MNFSFAKQFNKVTFSVDTTGFEYCKLSDLYNEKTPETIKIDGIFVNKSPLGFSPVAICADKKKLINLPSHLTETARVILADADAVAAIENGKVGFTVYEYEAKGKQCYSIKFVDL